MILKNTEKYADTALNSECIPLLPDSKKRSRAGDELQPWGDYATINPYEKIIADVNDVQACEADDEEFYKDEWWGWTNEHIRFLNNKLGLKALALAVPFIWVAIIFVTLFLLFLKSMDWLTYTVEAPDILLAIFLVAGGFGYLALSLYLVYLTTNWVMEKGIGTLIKPFEKFLQKKVDKSIANGMSEFNRVTGQAKFALGKGRYFEAPFIEFDPYISYHVQPKGPVSYKLQLRHRYSGWQTAVAEVHSTQKEELYAHWDELQRYMDVSQPLPDIPALEPYRHLDPTTAEYDAAGKRQRPADYWATLDLEWWEQEGYPAHMEKIRNFPWDTLEDQMQYSVPNLNEATMA